MAIREMIEQIASEWPGYHQKGHVDSADPVYDLVVRQFPQLLQPVVATHLP